MIHLHACPVCGAIYECAMPLEECSGVEPCAKHKRLPIDDLTCIVCGRPIDDHPITEDEWTDETNTSEPPF